MMRRARAGPALLLLPALALANGRSPCPEVVFVGSATIRMTNIERGLVCGHPETEGWKTVPLNQAKYFLQGFLQQRGYLNPTFKTEGSRLLVDIGTQTYVSRLAVAGMPPGTRPEKLRHIEGELLTPKRLDAIKSALTSRLQEHGFACPQIDLTAQADTGQVDVQVQPGPVYTIEWINRAQLSGLDPRIFNRYDAFAYGQRFDMRLLNLTAQRTMADSLFLSAHYDVACSSEGLAINQRVLQGKPRSFRIGGGADTEGYAVAVAQWKHSRIGWRASDAEVSLLSSYLQQSAEGSMHYFLEPDTRFYFMPQGSFARRDELRYSAIVSQEGVSPGTSWDFAPGRLETRGGPAFNYVHMLSGLGPASDTFLSVETRTDWVTHLFEYYSVNPREGWRASLETSSRLQGAYSDISSHRLKLSGQALWNLGAFDPPILVFGTRGYAATTYVNDLSRAFQDLSPEARYFVGGDDDLRGAERQQVPSDNAGFLTAAYDGLELRLGEVLPFGLQPFAFLDTAMMGRADFQLNPDVYWSPGAGLRWASPFGAVRTTVAHGFLWHRAADQLPLYSPHWQFYFSFGREF